MLFVISWYLVELEVPRTEVGGVETVHALYRWAPSTGPPLIISPWAGRHGSLSSAGVVGRVR